MVHGGYNKRRVADRKPGTNQRPKSLGVEKKFNAKPKSKSKSVSLRNQIRSTERMLRKDLPPEIKEAQMKKLEGLKKQNELQDRLAAERKIFLRSRKIRFFERRKIDRRIGRLGKQQHTSASQDQEADIAKELAKLKEDLEYVRFFPKTEKYVPLFVGGDNPEIVDKRNKLRKQIKDNIVAAAASGKDLEETGSGDDGLLDVNEDDFFLAGSSSDDANEDDELTDKSTREPAPSASGIAGSGMSSDERNQRQISARALLPPHSSRNKQVFGSQNDKSRGGGSSNKKAFMHRPDISTHSNTSRGGGSLSKKPFVHRPENSTNSNTSRGGGSLSKKAFAHRPEISIHSNTSRDGGSSSEKAFIHRTEIFTSSDTPNSFSRKRGPADSYTGNNDNISSNSDARKPRRKRRPKKKKEQA